MASSKYIFPIFKNIPLVLYVS